MEPNVTLNPSLNLPDECGWYPDHTRRVKVFWIGDRDVLNAMLYFFLAKTNDEMRLQLIVNNIPKDMDVLAVNHSFERRAFGFLLSHPSFDPIPEGMPAPDLIPLNARWEWVPVIKDK